MKTGLAEVAFRELGRRGEPSSSSPRLLASHPMYSVFKDFSISAAHFIPGHPGECRHLHGHNYRVRLVASAERLDALGMVVDFAELKRVAGAILDRYDHRVLNELDPFDRVPPTAEAISEVVYREASRHLDDDRVRVSRVEVWENDRACAVFEP